MSPSSDDSLITGARVLVVEDEFLIAVDVQRILEEAGAREVVLTARSAEALAALDMPEAFDAAVLDIRLGSESSAEIASALIDRRIPFVYGSGLSIATPPPDRFRHVPIVEKPYTSQMLMEALIKAMRDART